MTLSIRPYLTFGIAVLGAGAIVAVLPPSAVLGGNLAGSPGVSAASSRPLPAPANAPLQINPHQHHSVPAFTVKRFNRTHTGLICTPF